MSAFERISRRQQRAIPVLLATPTLKEASTELGVGESTLIRWLAQEPFQQAYRHARSIVMNEAFDLMQRGCTEAVECLLTIMRAKNSSPFVKLQAAQSILDMAMKSRTIEDMEARIEALEHEPRSTI